MTLARSLSWMLLLGVVGVVPFEAGCSGGDDAAPPVPEGAPGSAAYNDDIHCTTDATCGKGETCTNGLCQMKRCGDVGLAKAGSPIRSNGFMILDREILVAQGSGIMGYDAQGSSFTHPAGSTWSSTSNVVDIASGSLTGSRPETFVVANAGSSSLTLKQGTTVLTPIALGFVPIAIATGDTNMDGVDRVVATTASGTFAICDAKTSQCEKLSLGQGNVSDVAVGDVDGDGYSEVLFLVGDKIVVYNYDGGKTTQPKTISSSTGRALSRISAGDLDGDGVDEVVGLEPGEPNAVVHSMTLTDGSFTVKSSTDVSSSTLDLAVGGLGGDTMRVATVGNGNSVEVLDGKDDGSLAYAYTTSLASTANVTRIAFSDLDGNSVPARLAAAPKVVSGSLIPLGVLTPPPYSKTYSGEGHGDTRSSATIGSSATKGESADSNISLSAGIGLSYGFGLGPIVSASVGVHLSKSITKSKSVSHSTTVGQSFSFEARPDLDGFETGAVALGCGCFNQYDYNIDDPSGLLGKDGSSGKVSIFIPIGGQTTLWSLKRYNQLAAALKGELPTITVTQKAGDLSSYPPSPMSLGGKRIPGDDMIFANPPSFRVSDVASVNFALGMGEGGSEGTSTTTGVTVNASIGAFGATLSGDVGVSVGNGYSISVGKSTDFSGSVPPLRDNPNTPEDEFKLNSYSFTPVVYREHYASKDKKDAGYFVLTYAVGR
jgi:FG-GAP-like repeat